LLHIDSQTCDLSICLCPNMFIRVLIQQSFLVCFDLCSFKNKSFFVFKKFIFEEIMYVVIIVLNPCFSCTCICNKITNNTCSTHINQQQNFGFPNDIAVYAMLQPAPSQPPVMIGYVIQQGNGYYLYMFKLLIEKVIYF